MKKRASEKHTGESDSKLLSLVKRVSEVVGESLAYSICDVLQCRREELHEQLLTNDELHKWYQSMMYQLQRYHLRNEGAIQSLQAIISEVRDVEQLK